MRTKKDSVKGNVEESFTSVITRRVLSSFQQKEVLEELEINQMSNKMIEKKKGLIQQSLSCNRLVYDKGLI